MITPALQIRCEGTCELCSNEDATIAYAVSPYNHDSIEHEVAICETCNSLLLATDANDHWQCLAGSIWNPEPVVQALSFRILHQHREQSWAAEILGGLEMDESITQWALSAFEVAAQHLDANGVALENGDNVILTQVLNVKGANFMAPKGTMVRKIRLVPDNTEQIEGKINNQTIVILTKYVKKG